jgi:iron complex outermembrane receptor protein
MSAVSLRLVSLVGLAICGVHFAHGQSDPEVPPPARLKKLSVEELMDLNVTSVSKHPEKISATASAIQVITDNDIRRSGATSLPEALRLASNLEVAQIDARQWAITARGFNNVFADKMLVLIDGRTVYTPLYAGVYWDVQDTLLEDIDRIEVISGPGATQWGSNAVNGVINLTTKSAKDTQGGLLIGGAGTAEPDSIGARYGGELLPGLYYRTYVKYFDRSSSVDFRHNDGNDAWRMAQAGFRMDWEPSPRNVLTWQGDVYSGAAVGTGPDDTRMNGGNGLGRWSHTLENGSDVSLQFYYDYTHRSIPQSFTQTLGTYDVDFQYHLRLGEINDIVLGLGYRIVDDDITNTPANAFLPSQLVREWANVSAQDEIALVQDRLHLTVGSKLEHNQYTGFEVEPSVRAAWTPDTSQTAWMAVSRAVRTPSRIDRDLYSPATPPYRIAGGPNVVSEKLVAYELGYRVQIAAPLAISIATFYNNYDDLRSLEPLKPPALFPVVISSGLRGSSDGAQLSADWRIASGWRLRASYTEMRVRTEPEPGSPDRDSARSIAKDPNHQAQLRSLWDISPRWEFDSALRYVSQLSNQSVPGYVELNCRLGWQPAAAWELSLEGQNLLHDQHPEFNRPGNRRAISRGVYGKTSWHF